MSTPTRLTRSLPHATAKVALVPDGDRNLFCGMSLNGRVSYHDTAEFDTTAERDAALARTVALYEANGYERIGG